MKSSEFKRRCANRTRMVRVGGSQIYVAISARQAERLHRELSGAVEVDVTDVDSRYVFIRPLGTAR